MHINKMFLLSLVSVSQGSFQPEIWVADLQTSRIYLSGPGMRKISYFSIPLHVVLAGKRCAPDAFIPHAFLCPIPRAYVPNKTECRLTAVITGILQTVIVGVQECVWSWGYPRRSHAADMRVFLESRILCGLANVISWQECHRLRGKSAGLRARCRKGGQLQN